MRAAQTRRYLVYSEANFEVFRPAGATRCTDGGEIWHGGGDRTQSQRMRRRMRNRFSIRRSFSLRLSLHFRAADQAD